MQLLTKEIKKILPGLGGTENQDDPVVWVKFFTPDSCWTWYILEGSEQENGDWLLFAYVEGMFNEFGYVSLRELENVRGPLGLEVERDITFTPIPLSKVFTQNYD
jgi:hypothetical protein